MNLETHLTSLTSHKSCHKILQGGGPRKSSNFKYISQVSTRMKIPNSVNGLFFKHH